MMHFNYKKQVSSLLYNGPNPIRMTDQDWSRLVRPLSKRQIAELSELRLRARYASQMMCQASGNILATTADISESTMEDLLCGLSSAGVGDVARAAAGRGETV